LPPSEPALGCLAPLRYVLKPCAANPPGAGLVTRRRAVQVSWIEITEPKVPQRPHTAKRDNWAFVNTKWGPGGLMSTGEAAL